MYLFHQIGQKINSNFNTLEEILRCPGPISFDGLYKSVYYNRHALVGKEIILFIMGRYVGGNNKFDVGQPYSEYCTWDEIFEVKELTKAKIGYHSFSHKNLCLLSDDEVKQEVTPPFNMELFSYPYGNCDKRVEEIVKSAGYEAAYSVNQGDGSRYQMNRYYWEH